MEPLIERLRWRQCSKYNWVPLGRDVCNVNHTLCDMNYVRNNFAQKYPDCTTQLSGAYNAQHQNSSSTLNEGEVDKFSKMMSDWWDPVKGSAVGLHSMNDLRVPLVRDGMVNTLRTDPKESKASPFLSLVNCPV